MLPYSNHCDADNPWDSVPEALIERAQATHFQTALLGLQELPQAARVALNKQQLLNSVLVVKSVEMCF
jgi:hypothetical protein